jgi:hypothetical protein
MTGYGVHNGCPGPLRASGICENTAFATKPELARSMIERFPDFERHVGWVTGDDASGRNPKLYVQAARQW